MWRWDHEVPPTERDRTLTTLWAAHGHHPRLVVVIDDDVAHLLRRILQSLLHVRQERADTYERDFLDCGHRLFRGAPRSLPVLALHCFGNTSHILHPGEPELNQVLHLRGHGRGLEPHRLVVGIRAPHLNPLTGLRDNRLAADAHLFILDEHRVTAQFGVHLHRGQQPVYVHLWECEVVDETDPVELPYVIKGETRIGV